MYKNWEAGTFHRSEALTVKVWNILRIVSLGSFLVSLDGMIMFVGLAPIVRGLNITVSTFQTAIILHGLVIASLYLTGGRLGDVYGKKRMLQLGSFLFCIGTLIASVSPNGTIFILGWSIIKPIGVMLILTASVALIRLNYAEKKRTFSFGVYAATSGMGATIGPLLMGFLSTNLTWRMAFGFESFLAAVILVLTVSIRDTEKLSETRFDWLGAVLSLLGLASLVLGGDLAEHYGWWTTKKNIVLGNFQLNLWGLSPVPYMIIFGIILLAIFIAYQQRQVAERKAPPNRTKTFC